MVMNRISMVTAIGAALTAGSLLFAGPAGSDSAWESGNPVPAAYSTSDVNHAGQGRAEIV